MQMLIQENSNSQSKSKIVFYWVTTALVVFELLLGATWDFNWVNKGFVREAMSQLGFPAFFETILGVCKVLATIVIVLPGLFILKEWAYAGVVFIFAGAALCHLAMGNAANTFFPGVYALITIASWWLRPGYRRVQ